MDPTTSSPSVYASHIIMGVGPPSPTFVFNGIPPAPAPIEERCVQCGETITIDRIESVIPMDPERRKAIARDMLADEMAAHRREDHGLWTQQELRKVIAREIMENSYVGQNGELTREIAYRVQNGDWQKIPPLAPRP